MNVWKGTFASKTYGATYVRGDINILLPEEKQDEYTSECTITYRGFYRNGANVDVKITGQNSSFRGKVQNSVQTMEFVCDNLEATTASGTYSTFNPPDSGTFVLEKTEECVLLPPKQESSCTIM